MSATLTTDRLPRPLQRLIDARLDTIDRMLLGRLPRADRLAVVRDVEGQVHDLLGERPGHELDREDVLAVLARLDPPEAYIPEDGGFEATAVLLPRRGAPADGRANAPGRDRRLATVVGIVGLGVLGLVLAWPMAYLFALVASLGEPTFFLLLGISGLTLLAALPTLLLSIVARRGGPWAVVGMVAGGVGLAFAPASAAFVLLLG